MIVFVGGFSNSDVLGSAKGWAGAFLYNPKAKAALDNFYREIEFTKEFKNLDINEYLPRLMELLEQ
jgi:hypothetical protein